MCLCVKETVKKAAKDIVVYKVLNSDTLCSVYYDFKYIRGRKYNVKLRMKARVGDTISIGIHSCTSKHAAKRHMIFGENDKTYKFIIPKGSYYYVGTCGDIVSDRIIFPSVRRK